MRRTSRKPIARCASVRRPRRRATWWPTRCSPPRSAPGATRCTRATGSWRRTPSFARRCAEHGLTFVGPSPEAIEMMGDKIAGRVAAVANGVPVVPGSDASIEDIDAAKREADRHRLPAAAQGERGRRWPGHAGGQRAVGARGAARRGRRRGDRRHSPTRASTWSATSRGSTTSRSRSSATGTATTCTSASATAAPSAATRSSWRSRRRRC